MLLRSFGFNKDVITEKELSLLKYLVEHPEYKCDVAYDILVNAMNGRIDYTKEFNLLGYEARIKHNQVLITHERGKKEKSYDAPISDDSEDTMLEFLQEPKDFVLEFMDNELYDEAVSYILNTDYYNIISEEEDIIIDIKLSLYRALQGIPDAIKNIKLICQTDARLKEYIEVLLVNGIDDNLKEKLGGNCYGNH